MPSSSSSSSFSSSSSSIDFSSSSSSIQLTSYDKLLPFSFTKNKFCPTWDIIFHENLYYSANFEEILVSSNGSSWETFHKIPNEHFVSIIEHNGFIWGCTSSSGKIIRINPSSLSRVEYSVKNICVKLFEINSNMFLACDRSVYRYSRRQDKWKEIYKFGYTVNNVAIINNNAYFCLNAPFTSYFDGENFSTLSISKDIFNSSRVKIYGDNYNSFFVNRRSIDDGIQDIVLRNEKLYLGGNKFGRIYEYNFEEDKYSVYFETDCGPTNCLLTLDDSSFLASIYNKIYLIFEHDFESKNEEEKEEDEDGEEDNTFKNINIVSPSGGKFLLGDDISINWTSNRGLNDAIKIDLYKGGSFLQPIVEQTVNDGQYLWTSPLSLDLGDDYQIYIEWLSANNASEEDKDLSPNFSIVSVANEEALTGETPLSETNKRYFVPILELPEKEYVTTMTRDLYGKILFGTSLGRILETDNIDSNAYLTGNRKIYGEIKNFTHHISETAESKIMYALFNRIVEINNSKEIKKSVFRKNAVSEFSGNTKGVFISDIMFLQEEGSFWENLIWEEELNSQKIVLYVRFGNSVEELYNQEWGTGFESNGEIGLIEKSLDVFKKKGRYAQIKAELISNVNNSSPQVVSISLSYTAKNASYFFTTSFSIEGSQEMKNGLITGKISEISETEVIFGINNSNSNDWNDFKEVPLNKLFKTDKWKNIRVGIKLISYGNDQPSVSEFNLISGSDLKGVFSHE